MSDTYIIQGLSDIINKDNIRPDVDVGEIERKIISGVGSNKSLLPAADKFDKELNEIVRKYGISFDDAEQDAPADESSDDAHEPEPKYEKFHINFDDVEVDEPENTRFTDQTREEQKRSHIKNVIGVDPLRDFSLEKEREEDDKCNMLAEIDYLLDSLKEEGIDVSRIPTVDDNNDIKSIDKVLKVLRHKVDHSRYCTFAEEFMLSAAHGLEYLFDGKNMWFGRWNPDLTGWHIHVNRKLRRMRTDTGKIVSHVMSDYDIGPFLRICLELIPSMFLFSKKKQDQNSFNLDSSIDELKNI
jgi:hypothetical protein